MNKDGSLIRSFLGWAGTEPSYRRRALIGVGTGKTQPPEGGYVLCSTIPSPFETLFRCDAGVCAT